MAQLYIAKVNCDSHMLEVYKEKADLKVILDRLFDSIKEDVSIKREDVLTTHDDKHYLYSPVYSITGIIKGDSPTKYVAGNLYKNGVIFRNDFDEHGELKVYPETNKEVVSFYFDLYEEYICFYTRRRFSKDEITTAFSMIFTEICKEYEYVFSTELMRKGFTLDSFIQQLNELDEVQEIKVTLRAPNAPATLLNEIIEDSGEFIDELKESNVTQTSIVLTSKAPGGMNIKSKLVEKELRQIEELHESLDVEEASKKGYMSLSAKDKKTTISNKDTKPLQYTLEEISKSVMGVIETGREFIDSIK